MAGFGAADGAEGDGEDGEEGFGGLRIGTDGLTDLAEGGELGAAAAVDGL